MQIYIHLFLSLLVICPISIHLSPKYPNLDLQMSDKPKHIGEIFLIGVKTLEGVTDCTGLLYTPYPIGLDLLTVQKCIRY